MPEHILMIEDDQRLAAMVSEYLSAAGWRVATRLTATTGLTALEGHGFDALILDVMLPDLDGFEVCRRVRARSDVPILMLTARGEPIDRIVGLELGADDYLSKPFEPRELLARLRAILRRRTGAAVAETPVLRFGNLELRHDDRQVQINGQPRTLTGYQFDLLWVLAQNAGRVMSREGLMDRLKGQSLEAFDRSIDVHISRIRAAIEDDPKHPKRVITIRGTGYLFARRTVEEGRG
jgi:two-component system, OmpR family, phosphate regulon response regulator OmpR